MPRPDRCHACFKDIKPDRFALREQHLKALLSTIDSFVAPSEFLKRRYVEWGIAESRIAVITNGLPVRAFETSKDKPKGGRPTFGYFGNLNPWKGTKVLLEAARRLTVDGVDFELRVHGGAPFQSPEFLADIERLFRNGTSGAAARTLPA